MTVGGELASMSARYMKVRDTAGPSLYGGVVGFAPDGGVTPWMQVESGAPTIRSTSARRLGIGKVSGDLGVFGVFIAADSGQGTSTDPTASIGLIRTRSGAPGWVDPADVRPWWFSVAGEGYSLDPIKVKTNDESAFNDILHP